KYALLFHTFGLQVPFQHFLIIGQFALRKFKRRQVCLFTCLTAFGRPQPNHLFVKLNLSHD
ncbi:hypothetical protein, partial [Neisseria meningitidis]|uniref:hypothetical protein n=1 Tax=Neisseria meningitidis TaxID=487 RepID=UPI001C993545